MTGYPDGSMQPAHVPASSRPASSDLDRSIRELIELTHLVVVQAERFLVVTPLRHP
jgi:hypothetical protein